MHNELRYQARTHAISEKLSKEKNKIRHLLPNFLFFLVENKYIEKQQDMLMEKEMTSSPSM
jgi:hypothetical protein